MKRVISLTSCFLIFVSSISCKNETQDKVQKIDAQEKYTKLEKANWFLGTWKNTSAEMDLTESWQKETDSSYRAQSFIIVSKDTVFFEHVLLQETNDSLFYKVYNRNEKLSDAVSFYATILKDNQIVFENPNHDYPSKITYKKLNNDSIVAIIEGIKNGKPLSEKFSMRKNK